MGAWGEGIFDNDDACDFANTVAATTDLSRVRDALEAVLEAGEYLEAPTASEGLAAADIVSRLRGHNGQTDAYTEKIDKWVKKMKLSPSEELLGKARTVVDRVRTEPSELLELWSEDDPTIWLATLDALKQRLEESPAPVSVDEPKSLLARLLGLFRS
jgi:hypothetical protein